MDNEGDPLISCVTVLKATFRLQSEFEDTPFRHSAPIPPGISVRVVITTHHPVVETEKQLRAYLAFTGLGDDFEN